jgi:putative spermidine/putrescine transport system permease protein
VDRAIQQDRRDVTAETLADRETRAIVRVAIPVEWQLALPLLTVFVAIFVASLSLLAFISFAVDNELTSFGPDQYVRFATDPFHWRIALNTVLLGLKTVACTVVMAYPLALLYLEIGPRARRLLVFAIVLPLLTGTVVRTFAWVVILGSEGLVNSTVLALGLSATPVRLLHTEAGLVLSLMQIELPIMLLPLLSVMHRLDRNLIDASMSLGAGRWRTLRRVIVPLSLPGLFAGAILVFASSVTSYFSQTIIGGARLIYLTKLIYEQAMIVFNWPFAATIAMVLMVAVLSVIALLALLGRRAGASAYG